MRLNFSHGEHDEKREIIRDLRDELKRNRDRGNENVDWSDGSNEMFCSILADLKGPEIRTGTMSSKGVSSVPIEFGSKVVLTTNSEFKTSCDASKVYVDHVTLAQELKADQIVFVDDGLIKLRVIETSPETGEIKCEAINSGMLGERKGINLPGVVTNLPAVTEQDKLDLRFCVEQKVDFVAASFVRCADHVREVRDVLNQAAQDLGMTSPTTIKIISKIENQEGIDNFDEILEASDGIMVARGDLGIEIPSEKVFLAQKMMLAKCQVHRKLSVCATQMLESMVGNPRPTRAEAGDVANAVLDGSDVVMLSGETAKGSYWSEAVKIMSRICQEAETAIDNTTRFKQIHEAIVEYDRLKRKTLNIPTQSKDLAMAAAIVHMATSVDAAMILVVSQYVPKSQTKRHMHIVPYGRHILTRSIAAMRPDSPILYATENENTHGASQIMMHRGVQPLLLPAKVLESHKDLLHATFEMGKRMGVCVPGDPVIVVSREDLEDGQPAVPAVKIVAVE